MGKGQVGKHAIPLKWYFKPEIKSTRNFEDLSQFCNFSISSTCRSKLGNIEPLGSFVYFWACSFVVQRLRWKKNGSGSSRKRNKSVFKHQRDEGTHIKLHLEHYYGYLIKFHHYKWIRSDDSSNYCCCLRLRVRSQTQADGKKSSGE